MIQVIALQRPSSVGIRPVEFLIERFSADGLLVYQPINLSKKVLTGQLVLVQPEAPQCRAEAEFRGNVPCAARRAYSEVGILVNQTGLDEHKIGVPVSWLSERTSQFTALHRPSSVGIRPVKYLSERLSAAGTLVYQTGPDEHKSDIPLS